MSNPLKRFKYVSVHTPEAPLSGRITLPGSKSITNRALLICALADGNSRLSGALSSDDTVHMKNALNALGVTVVQENETTFSVASKGKLGTASEPLFLGNAGTAMRFLTAASALGEGQIVLDGDEHMRKRPIGPLVKALNELGVQVGDSEGYPPVTVQAIGTFPHNRVEIDGGLSSQYISAILMAGACCGKPLDVLIKSEEDIGGAGYIGITLSVMRAFGATVTETGKNAWRVDSTGYQAREFEVEPDASAATYFWAAEKLIGNGIDIGVKATDMVQPDSKAFEVMNQFPDMPAVIDGSQMQDAVPTMAVLAMFNNTPVRFVGIANLRVKECDRIRAVCTEINRIKSGLAIEEGDDLVVHSDPCLAGQTLNASIETYSDHRIAMSFALAGLRIKGITILDPACVSKTFPNYWLELEKLGVKLSFSE